MQSLLPDDEFIWWLYKGRCVVCFEPGAEINEIIPRSRTNKALKSENRVLMCVKHHHEYHQNGLTEDKLKELKERRIEFLISIGREEYV